MSPSLEAFTCVYAHSPVFRPCWQAVCPPFVAGWGVSQAVLPSPPWLHSGHGGLQGGVFRPHLVLPRPLPSACLLPRGHRFPCHVGRELPACLQEQLGLVPSAVADSCSGLDNPGCVPGGWRLAEAPWLRPRPCRGLRAGSLEVEPAGSPFLQGLCFPRRPACGSRRWPRRMPVSFLKGVLTLGLAPFSRATARPGAVSRDATARGLDPSSHLL